MNTVPQMKTLVFQGQQADDRLQQMGLDTPMFHDVLLQAYNARAMQTENSPPAAPGFVMWAEMYKAQRERLCVRGWRKVDRNNISRTMAPDDSFGIINCTGDKATGQPHATPTPKRTRGESSIGLLRSQLPLFQNNDSKSRASPTTPVLWICLFRVQGGTIFCELSRPASVTDDGVVTLWYERILLPIIRPGSNAPLGSQTGPSSLSVPSTTPAPQPEVAVRKKKSP